MLETSIVIKGKQVTAYDVGNIVLYNKNTKKKIVIDINSETTDFPISDYTPIGVVVIPKSHNVYGTGEAGVMSLVDMDYRTPDTGGSVYMNWGCMDIAIPSLPYYTYTVAIGNNGEVTDSILDFTDCPYLPSDKVAIIKNPYDEKTYYSVTDKYLAPSPYLNNGNRNPLYYTEYNSKDNRLNPLSDFDGKSNAQKILAMSTGQSNWKTANTITNNGDDGYAPASCCCWRFSTEGTSQGDWYLPAIGELGYMVVRANTINTTLNFLSEYVKTYPITLSSIYWASTIVSDSLVKSIRCSDGLINTDFRKNYQRYVKAFTRI